MILNKKSIALLQKGIDIDTVKSLNESQINKMYSLLFNEQTVAKTGTIAVKKADASLAKDLAKAGYNVRLETEMGEQKNPWAICTAQMGKEFGTSERSKWNKNQKNKYERCVKDVKKSLKEGKEPFHYFVNNQIETFLESIRPFKIQKSDLLDVLSEQKPITKPVTKPTTKPTERDNPFQNPRPGIKIRPKADSPTTKPTTKPITKPTTKPTERDNPFQNPRPGIKIRPKANAKQVKQDFINVIKNITGVK